QMLSLFHDTIAAISTAEGRAALAIVRISGQDAIEIVSKIVSDPETLWVARTGGSIYTQIKSNSQPHHTTPQPPPLSEEGEIIDDVVIHVFRAPRSYTGEDLCEITAHGS